MQAPEVDPRTKARAPRVAVLSCIHGNIEALEAVFDDLREADVDDVICLGDLVGYGPYPNEVIRFIRQHDIRCVRGCWDTAIGERHEDCGCKFASEEDAEFGKAVFGWTLRRVTGKTRRFLTELPFGVLRRDTPAGAVLYVHGSPRSASEYLTETTHDLLLFERAAAAECDVLVCGHTHVPFARKIEGTLRVRNALGPRSGSRSRSVALQTKLIVNAGSVGEPRDGRPESSYVVLDTASGAVEIRRVAYDVAKTAAAMRRRGLPEPLADRLLHGSELAEKDMEQACAC